MKNKKSFHWFLSKKPFLFLIFLSFSSVSWGRPLVTRIMSLKQDHSGDYIVKSTSDGRTYQLSKNDRNTVKGVILAHSRGDLLEIEINDRDDSTIRGMVLRAVGKGQPVAKRDVDIDRQKELTLSNCSVPSTPYGPDFKPSILNSLEFTDAMFKALRPYKKNSEQCYKRAEVWSADMWQDYGINSGKMYIFWGKKWRSKSGWPWWFHAAPYVWAKNEKGELVEMVFEKKHHSSGPIEVKEWAKFFGSTKNHNCLDITKDLGLEEYDRRNETRKSRLTGESEFHHYDGYDCFIARAPMYFYGPTDLYKTDKLSGADKSDYKMDWDKGELRSSASEFLSIIRYDMERSKLPRDMCED